MPTKNFKTRVVISDLGESLSIPFCWIVGSVELATEKNTPHQKVAGVFFHKKKMLKLQKTKTLLGWKSLLQLGNMFFFQMVNFAGICWFVGLFQGRCYHVFRWSTVPPLSLTATITLPKPQTPTPPGQSAWAMTINLPAPKVSEKQQVSKNSGLRGFAIITWNNQP